MSGEAVPLVSGFAVGVAVFVCLIGFSGYIKRKTRLYNKTNWYQSIDRIMSNIFYWLPEQLVYGIISIVIGIGVIRSMWI